MTWWEDLAHEYPDFTERVRSRFQVRKHGTMATLRQDGSPRISGTEFDFSDEGLHLGSMPNALKALDLRRDPRLGLHCPTEDAPEEDPASWGGDAKISGIAHEITGGEGESHRFRIEVTEVVLTKVTATELVLESWHPGRGIEITRRK